MDKENVEVIFENVHFLIFKNFREIEVTRML